MFVSLFLYSCDKKDIVEKAVVGEYTIVYIANGDTDLLHNLTLNIIEFHKDGSLKLPGIVSRNSNLKEDKTSSGTWKVYEKKAKFFIDIITSNSYLKGTYEISFGVNKEKELLQTLLVNDKVTIGAEKVSFNCAQNKSFVEKLTKYTSSEIRKHTHALA